MQEIRLELATIQEKKYFVRCICVGNWHGSSYALFIFCKEQTSRL